MVMIQPEHYRKIGDLLLRQNAERTQPNPEEEVEKIRSYIIEIGSTLAKVLDFLIAVKDRFSINYIQFDNDVSSKQQYHRFWGISTGIWELDQYFQPRLEEAFVDWQSFGDFHSWILDYFQQYKIDERHYRSEYGDECYEQLEAIRNNFAVKIEECTEVFEATVHYLIYC